MGTCAVKEDLILTESEEECEPVTGKETLTFQQLKEHFRDVAQRALPLWGYPEDSELTLLNITENATYKVEHPGFNTIVMRVHRLIYAEKDSIRTEIAWLLNLRKNTELNLAEPLPALNGTYVQTVFTPALKEARHVVCFSYVRGKAPRDSHDDTGSISGIAVILDKVPKKITIPVFRFAAAAYDCVNRLFPPSKNSLSAEDAAMYRKLGEIAAVLHSAARQWTFPGFYSRIEWDWDATFSEGWNNFYGAHYRELTNMLSASDIAAIEACEALMKKRLLAYGKSPDRYGLIHSDLRMPNLLQDGDKISVLDFDDCGMGWYLYDIAGVVGFMEHRPDLPRILSVIAEGYRSRAELSEEDEREIPTFVMMRRIGLLQAISYHLNNTAAGSNEAAELTPEILAFYAKGTAVLAKRYTKKFRDVPLAARKN